ncbi:DUF3298 and DUF4163 domain-containing protein [Maribacter ulvicola]|uniref:DUF3298 domain-containing protein n=1 Tax=Maribacter ulvicola TaxID=228959 RepID=A0A1N6P0X1_9FLAO|nr:DUF3298 and DUF4163 domain-containing protein [Maribacter ulvicola]SIP97933.1 Protein of unknown function [Maribacter ulvicola]
MKLKLTYILSCFLFLACNDKNSVSFEPLLITTDSCENCTLVRIEIPQAVQKTKLGKTINAALEGEIIALLNFDEESNAENLAEAKEAFLFDYEELAGKFPEESTPWEATVEGTITFENNRIITIKLESYIYTGGAHGYGTNRFLNFDKLSGKELYQEDLFNNLIEFKGYAETVFRKQENIPITGSINKTGFMFETERFYLPDNIGYTENGLLLFYEPYEIASFADGPIILTIPYTKANSFLKYPSKP